MTDLATFRGRTVHCLREATNKDDMVQLLATLRARTVHCLRELTNNDDMVRMAAPLMLRTGLVQT